MSSEEKRVNSGPPAASPSPEHTKGVTPVDADANSNTSDSLGLGRDEDVPPPAYGAIYGQILDGDDGSGTRADVTDDGRVNIRINQQTRGLSSLLVPALRSQLNLLATKSPTPYVPPSLAGKPGERPPPPLNIVIHVVGSRGDVQPFVALGKVLKEVHKHRVRLATHPVFKDFVEEQGLEFFNISGDPAELMAFMVKNPGLMPGFDTLRRGDIGRRRRDIGNMVRRCWRSCIETGDGSGVEASDKNIGEVESSFGTDPAQRPFVADAIIANPPSFAHIHCAEKLGIPLHMMFTMPWSPTQSFPHPLANIQSTNADASLTNFITYGLVDMMTWQGLGDVINRFRQKSLGLEPISLTWAPGMLARLRVPWTYCWSPALIPKPRDWGPYISISGFYFLNLASNYAPAQDLATFLAAGPPPVYIGFGSIVVDDPDKMTKMIFEAVKTTGQRALVSKGWGGLGADQLGIPDGVFMLGNVPHDWLFQHVSAVVHHGGAGTTAAGISSGKPTVVVPFFGDQPFWGAMVARAGAGPKPIAYKELTAAKLAESINYALEPSTVDKAQELAASIESEKGTEVGAQSFHRGLDIDKLRCTLCPTRAAVWRLKRTEIKLSPFAAAVLGNEKLIKFSDLKLHRPKEHFTEDEPFDPISGGASALVGTLGSMAMGIADMPVAALKALKIHPESQESKPRQNEGNSGVKSPTSAPLSTVGSPDSAGTETSEGVREQPEAAHEIANQMAQAAEMPHTDSSDSQPQSRPKFNTEESNSKIDTKPISAIKVPYNMEDAIGTGQGILRIASAGIKSPMDFTLGLARGFHNAPKLYGDESVRQSEKITGLSSGLRAAGREFGFGMYDGISGLVSQPLEGAKKEGTAGFFKGFGKGIGGIVLKPGAAVWGLPGYTAQGIYKELQKRFGPSVENYIIASRTAQGYEDLRQASEQEMAAVVRRWKEIKPYVRKKKTFSEEQKEQVSEVRDRIRERSFSKSNSKAMEAEHPLSHAAQTDSARPNDLKKTSTTTTEDSGVWSPIEELSRAQSQHIQKDTLQEVQDQQTVDPDFEEAVHRSVKETSKGNADEDALIEKAIRVSIAELYAARARGADDAELKQAMEQSIREATEGLRTERNTDLDSGLLTDHETEDNDGNEELQRALKESEAAHKDKEDEDEKAMREEEIVMKYVMRQSLAEEQLQEKKRLSD